MADWHSGLPSLPLPPMEAAAATALSQTGKDMTAALGFH